MVFLVSQTGTFHSYLLFQRRALPEYGLPAFWQAITGALEPDETFAEAAIREVDEEAAIRLGFVIDTGFQYRFSVKPEWRSLYGQGPSHIEQQVFYAVVPATTVPRLSPEHQDWRWCFFQEAEELLTFGGSRECLLAVHQHLASTFKP